MKGKKRLLTGVFVGSLFMATVANADDVSTATQKIQDLQSSLHSSNQQIDQAQQKKDQATTQVSNLQQSLDLVKQKIDANQQEIDSKTSQANQLDDQIQQNQAKLDKDQQILNQQIRALYEHGDVSYLSVLMSASSFDDFLTRFEDMSLMANESDKVVQDIKNLKQQLASQKQQVQSDLATAKQKQQELAVLNQTYQTMQQQAQQQADDAQSQMASAQANSAEIQSEIAFAQQELANAKAHPIAETGPVIASNNAVSNVSYSASGNSASGASGGSASSASSNSASSASSSAPSNSTSYSGSASASQIISYAEQFMGTPYVWGGTQPGGFDCSGFTQYVYNHFGIPLSRTSQSQFSEGASVSDLQPGDLVFFSTYAPGATHVGIYIGSGLMVNAEDNGVRVDNIHNPYYWGPRYIGARRIMQ